MNLLQKITKLRNPIITKMPVIGIVPAYDIGVKLPDSKESMYLRREYTKIIASVGATPLVLNFDMPIETIIQMCDGIVIAGGDDIDPALYNQERLFVAGKPQEPRVRSEWEFKLIAACDRENKPILGICYGMQMLNIYYGGTLTQDIPSQRASDTPHWRTTHDIIFKQDYLGYAAGDERTIESRHHQAVDVLADGFEVCAEAPDGLIEAIRRGNRFGMQWHPESDITGVHVYRAFVEQCSPVLAILQR